MTTINLRLQSKGRVNEQGQWTMVKVSQVMDGNIAKIRKQVFGQDEFALTKVNGQTSILILTNLVTECNTVPIGVIPPC